MASRGCTHQILIVESFFQAIDDGDFFFGLASDRIVVNANVTRGPAFVIDEVDADPSDAPEAAGAPGCVRWIRLALFDHVPHGELGEITAALAVWTDTIHMVIISESFCLRHLVEVDENVRHGGVYLPLVDLAELLAAWTGDAFNHPFFYSPLGFGECVSF